MRVREVRGGVRGCGAVYTCTCAFMGLARQSLYTSTSASAANEDDDEEEDEDDEEAEGLG